MSVDVEIYISNFKNFFKSNPNDLLSLVPKEMEEEFYDKVKVASTENVKRGDDPQLTQKQIIDICVEINRSIKKKLEVIIISNIGIIILLMNLKKDLLIIHF
jgi:hypothetical protein